MNQPFDWAALEARLREHVEELASAPRPPGSDRHREVAGYIRRHLTEFGFEMEEGNSGVRAGQYANVMARAVPECDLPLMICGAHYDSLEQTPGADDNASGVASLIELARWVRPELERTARPAARLQLVAYDMEEYGMLGSLAHSAEIKRRGVTLAGMMSLEMLGYTDHRPGSQRLPAPLRGMYSDVGNFIGVCGNEASRAFMERVASGLRQVEGLPVEALAVPGRGEMLPDVRRSDHSSFWYRGMPAVMITDTSFFRNPHYHQPSDTPGTLDYAFLAKVTAGVCQVVRQMIGR